MPPEKNHDAKQNTLEFIRKTEALIKIGRESRAPLSEIFRELQTQHEHELLTNEELLWNVYAKTYPALLHLKSYRKLQTKVVDSLQAEKGMQLADLGCGVGLLERRLEIEKILGDLSVVCLEKSQAMRDEVLRNNWHNVEVQDCDLTEPLPIESDSLDRVVCANVFGFLEEEKANHLLQEIHRSLRKKSGELILTTQARDFDLGQILREQAGEPEMQKEKWKLRGGSDFGWMIDATFSEANPEIQKDFLTNFLVNSALLKIAGNSAPYTPSAAELEEMFDANRIKTIKKERTYSDQYHFFVGKAV